MNILQVLPKLEMGGVETGIIDLCKEVKKKGHKVIVVSGGGRMVKNLNDADVKHIELSVHRKSLFSVISNIKKLEQVIRDEHIDIVHARSRVPAIIAFFAARRAGARFVTTAHGYYSTHFFSRPMAWAKYVIVPSSVIGRHMKDNFGLPHDRMRFIARGVDLDKFKYNMPDVWHKEVYKIGVIGRITPIKGHRYFLQAIARVVRVFPKVKVVIVGEAPKDKPEYYDRLKVLVKQLGIEDFVEFLGAQYDIPNIMHELDIVVLPSIYQESFGRVIIESGASGVPCIATRLGGALEIIENGITGLLVKPGDILEMVEAILRLLKDRGLARSIAVEARKRIEKEYSLKRMVEGTLAVYEEALNSKNILVIKLGAIGDVMLVVPSLRLLRKNFPDAHISVLTQDECKYILKNCPYIDDIILYDRNDRDKGIKGLFKKSAIIRRRCFDMSIDFQNNRQSHLLAWLGGVPDRYGYNNKKLGFLLNNGLKYLKILAAPVSDQFRILKKAGINTLDASTYLEIWPRKEDHLFIEKLLKEEWVNENQFLAGFNIGASPRWQTKVWPLENFAKLADMLAEKDIRVIITGTNDDSERTRLFLKMTQSKPINAVGRTSVLQLAALISKCKVFVTGDSAPMHIASSMGVSFIALFGPTDPRRHFEPTQKGIVIKNDSKCSPCYKPKCRKMYCMKQITVEEVFKAVMEKIGT